VITFNATITDNGDLSMVQFSFTGTGSQTWDMVKGEDGRFEFANTFITAGTYNFTITAVDEAGNTQTYSSSVNVVA